MYSLFSPTGQGQTSAINDSLYHSSSGRPHPASALNTSTQQMPAFNPIEKAVLAVNDALSQDNKYPDLSERLGVTRYNDPTTSGLNECDYPSLADDSFGLTSLRELGQVKRIPLPAELVERFAYMQSNCMMGMFTEIKRAWLTIDNDIFIWNFEDGTDVAYFDGLSETILSVGLARPKPGIFQPHIVRLLVLATPVDIVILGVTFLQTAKIVGQQKDQDEYSEMHLLPEPLFSLPTDAVHMVSVASTPEGRIFLSGKDGCLYEVVYQADDGWFSRKCRKINHSKGTLSFILPSFLNFSLTDGDPMVQIAFDESRNVLYTRSEKGAIQVFDLGIDGSSMKRVAAVSWQTTIQNATAIVRTTERSMFDKLVHIAAVSLQESSNISLVAVTHTGCRLYFTTYPFGGGGSVFGGMYAPNELSRPSVLSLIHVRLPPGFTVHGPQAKPCDVHSAFYRQGVLLLLSARTEDSDTMWTLSDDNFPFSAQLSETYDRTALDGRTWSIDELPVDIPHGLCDGADVNNSKRPDPPFVVTQHLQIDRKFVIVNAKGTYIITKLNPVEQLNELLLNHGPESTEVKSYFRLYKEQASATCLVLMCSRSLQHEQVNSLATRAFFMYSTDPDMATGPSTSAPALGMPFSSTPYQGIAPHQLSFRSPSTSQLGGGVTSGHQGVMSPAGATNLPGGPQQELIFSSKHRGLCLYISRILRPVWERLLVKEVINQKTTGDRVYLTSCFSSDLVMWIFHKLHNLRDFIDSNSLCTPSALPDSFSSNLMMAHRTPIQPGRTSDGHFDEQGRRRLRLEAEFEENQSLKQLQSLVSLVCEYLGLLKILCDHQFHLITCRLNQDQINTLITMTFRDFVSVGHSISQALINALLDMYIENNASIEAICRRLRDVCPTLYSCGDEIYSRANQELAAARQTVNCMERDQLIRSALENYKMIAGQLDVPSVCSQLAAVRCYSGIVDLVLIAAPKSDPQNLALNYYSNGLPPSDIAGMQAYNQRRECYRCITETLDYLLSAGQRQPVTSNVPLAPGPPPPHDVGRLSAAEAEKYAEDVYLTALKSNDQMFHIALYDWLLCKNLSERLLSIQSPFLESYLKHGVATQSDRVAMLDLMWKYYEKQRNFSGAARILVKLAEKNTPDLTLQQRVEYLARASLCAKCVTSNINTPGDGDFLHEVEDKLEVARLQLQIVDALKACPSVPQRSFDQLNSQLFDISELYSEFAEVYNLSECKLSILHCADHFDLALVECLWKDIIDKEIQLHASDKRSCLVAVTNKVVALGRKYSLTENYFPLAFLVKYLETVSVKNDLMRIDLNFVFHAMIDIGVTLPKLIAVYDQLFKSRDQCWTVMGRPYHLLSVVRQMLVEYVDKPTLVAAYERATFCVRCQDTIAQYLVQLQADSTTNSDMTRQLIQQLQDLQLKLRSTLSL